MQKPFTLTDAVAVVRRSKLVPEDRLRPYLDAASHVFMPSELFADMIRHGLLTPFQASQLEHGRWRGFEIGNYRVLDRLGQGGMGQVYLAEHVTLGKRFAIKVLNKARNSSPLALERFIREARAAAKLDHANIIHVYDINTHGDPPFIVLEYVDGISLQAAVSRHGAFAPGDAVSVIQQIALGLDEAFRNGIVHRDVKPANILVDRRGFAKLLDLGIVRMEGESMTSEYAASMILGTLDFLSPEQSRNSSAVDTRADIYSLGATLYFLLTGQSPLPGGPVKQRLQQLQTRSPQPIRNLRPEVPPELALVLHRMLALDPADRYQTPAETAEALAPFAVPVPPFPASLFRSNRSTLSDIDQGAVTPPAGITEASLKPLQFLAPLSDLPPKVANLESQLAQVAAESAEELERFRRQSRSELFLALEAQKRRHTLYALSAMLVIALVTLAWLHLKK